jgi:thioredoxin-related protein
LYLLNKGKMKNIKYLILLALLAFTSQGFSQTGYNFNEALSQGKAQNKKIIIEIYIPDNTWVDKMNGVYAEPAIASILGSSFILGKLNATGTETYNYDGKTYTASDLAKYFEAMSYPTHVFLNPDGSVITFLYNGTTTKNVPGYIDAKDFEQVLIYFRDGKTSTDLSTIL